MKRVLVVDDTKNIRTLLTKCLELEGYSVSTAEDGRSALAILEKQRFDLAFLDIKMPSFSGTEVLRRMREMGIFIPVIIITAYATVKNAVDCTQLGAVAYLQKPFTAEKIKGVLKELFCAATPLQEPPDGAAKELDSILRKARKLLSDGDGAAAILKLKSALAENPFSPELYTLLAKASEKEGRVKDAENYQKLHDALCAGE